MTSSPTPAELAAMARAVYGRGLPWHTHLISAWRPLYTPFDAVLRWIPPQSTLLDIGCGTGALLLIADRLGRLRRGYGVDRQAASLAVARAANRNPAIEFHCQAEVPDAVLGACDVVAIIDVLHHVPAAEKAAFLDRVAGRVAPGTRLILKDLDPRPRWRALANRITDFLSTRSRVDYLPMTEVVARLEAAGFAVEDARRLPKHVWSHYLVVARKRA